MIYAVIILTALAGILATLLAVKTGKLKQTKKELEDERESYKAVVEELRAIKTAQEKINEIQKEKPPQTVSSPTSGDVASRIERLNGGVSEQQKA